MKNVEFKFSIGEITLALIDELSGARPREELLRHIMELGISELLESTARTHRDYTNHVIAGQTKDYRQARNSLFTVGESKADGTQERGEPFRVVGQREAKNSWENSK